MAKQKLHWVWWRTCTGRMWQEHNMRFANTPKEVTCKTCLNLLVRHGVIRRWSIVRGRLYVRLTERYKKELRKDPTAC